MKQHYRFLVAVATALIAILATGNARADMPDNTFGTVGTAADGSYLVEVGRGVSVARVVDYYDKIYREATKNDDEPNGEQLTWGVIHAENEGRVIPYCSHPKNGPKWLPTRSTMVWNECDENDRSIILIAGPSGRIKVPVKAVESFAQMQARLIELDAFVKSLGCKRSDVACLKSKVASGSSAPAAPTAPPAAKKPSTAVQTPVELKKDNERLTEANEILAGSITELTKNLEGLKGEKERLAKTNERLEETNRGLQNRPSLDTVYTIAGVGGPGLLLVGLLFGTAIMAMRRPKAERVLPSEPRPLPAPGMFTERQVNERIQLAVSAAVLEKTDEANRVNAELAATSATAILAETKKREAAEARARELEPQKIALEKILGSIGLADSAYNTLAFADSVANAFGGSLMAQDRPVEDPGAREKLYDRFVTAMKGVYDAIGLAIHRDGDYVASLFSPPKRSALPAASQTPPTSAVPSSGGGFEGTSLATLPGGLKALPPPKIDQVDHGSEDSGAYAPFSDPVGDAALAAHTGSLAQAAAEPKTITLPYGIGVGDPPPMEDPPIAPPVPGNGAATVHLEPPPDDQEVGRVSKTPTLRPVSS